MRPTANLQTTHRLRTDACRSASLLPRQQVDVPWSSGADMSTDVTEPAVASDGHFHRRTHIRQVLVHPLYSTRKVLERRVAASCGTAPVVALLVRLSSSALVPALATTVSCTATLSVPRCLDSLVSSSQSNPILEKLH